MRSMRRVYPRSGEGHCVFLCIVVDEVLFCYNITPRYFLEESNKNKNKTKPTGSWSFLCKMNKGCNVSKEFASVVQGDKCFILVRQRKLRDDEHVFYYYFLNMFSLRVCC